MAPPKVRSLCDGSLWYATLCCDRFAKLQDIRSFFGGAPKGGGKKPVKSNATSGVLSISCVAMIDLVICSSVSELLQ